MKPKEVLFDGKILKFCLNGCGKLVPERNSKYCSQECSAEFYAKHNQAGLREYVFKRENGKCQLCGFKNQSFPIPSPVFPEFPNEPKRPGWFGGENGKSLHRKAMIAYHKELKVWEEKKHVWLDSEEYTQAIIAHNKANDEWGNKHDAWYSSLKHKRSFVADHIIPVALGGPEFDLNNVQLLCEVCNKKKTAKDMANIGKRRRLIKRVGKTLTPLTDFGEKPCC